MQVSLVGKDQTSTLRTRIRRDGNFAGKDLVVVNMQAGVVVDIFEVEEVMKC